MGAQTSSQYIHLPAQHPWDRLLLLFLPDIPTASVKETVPRIASGAAQVTSLSATLANAPESFLQGEHRIGQKI